MTSAGAGHAASADHPQDLSLREQARAIATGELDATELLEATLSRIEERDSELNSIVDRFASESAQMLNEAPEGPLHGVPSRSRTCSRCPGARRATARCAT